MDATPSIPPLPRELDRLSLTFFCLDCSGVMVRTMTYAHEIILACRGCGHEVAWSTRFLSCRVGEGNCPDCCSSLPLSDRCHATQICSEQERRKRG